MGTPHVHAELIKAWADGAEIQYRGPGAHGDEWEDTESPAWLPTLEYRIKPVPTFPVVVQYPSGRILTGIEYLSQSMIEEHKKSGLKVYAVTEL